MTINPIYWLRLRRFKKHFLSLIVTEQDGALIHEVVSDQPIKVYDMGFAAVGSFKMVAVDKKSIALDQVPFRLFYMLVDRDNKNPEKIKEIVVDKLRERFSFRWCYGTETQFS